MESSVPPVSDTPANPIMVCVLGRFRVIRCGVEVRLRSGGKAENLLGVLALSWPLGVSRDAMVDRLWPDRDSARARQSLNTLTYSLHRLLGDALGGEPPVHLTSGQYRLNSARGVTIDVAAFEEAASAADSLLAGGDSDAAIRHYEMALARYTGDLAFGSDVHALLERERLRARHISILARMADQYFAANDYSAALSASLSVLSRDPCQEYFHRVVMRCLVRLGFRAQALRQYQVCREVLAMEFEALPEAATEGLFTLIRTNPALV